MAGGALIALRLGCGHCILAEGLGVVAGRWVGGRALGLLSASPEAAVPIPRAWHHGGSGGKSRPCCGHAAPGRAAHPWAVRSHGCCCRSWDCCCVPALGGGHRVGLGWVPHRLVVTCCPCPLWPQRAIRVRSHSMETMVGSQKKHHGGGIPGSLSGGIAHNSGEVTKTTFSVSVAVRPAVSPCVPLSLPPSPACSALRWQSGSPCADGEHEGEEEIWAERGFMGAVFRLGLFWDEP